MFKIRQYLAMSLAIVAMCVAIGPALASELAEQQQQVQQQMQIQQEKAAEAKQKVNSVADQLHKVQMELDNAQGDYNAIQAKRSATEELIAVNTTVLAKAEKNLSERSLVLNKRIRDIYQNGQLSYLDVLFGANDFSDFTTRMDLLKRIMNKDIELIIKVKAERELVLQKRAELESDKAAILQLEQAAIEKKKIIESSKKEREAVLASAVNERDAAEQSYQELLETSRKIEQMIRQSQSGKQGSSGGTGTMMWPTDVTEITSPYGWRTHPIFGTSRYHSGIDIGADYGDSVRAADSGVVIYADWMGGYGKAVIIEHGNGISTLYGHNSELLVVEGQRVRKGEVISRVGSTGYSTGPHLHFEVRENGSPTSPMDYLP
ncbi:murein hydrolase activator EnvC family protein [Pelosinus propionicus]|uniref:Murein DD-endopeptidase MepM and murein hydrolase activator NlpD, contain LysM domain n=1 Tax=Pelosinus propionicus DSM 13327 TaxID=1123291 RepID=A0A1I4HVX6_9FIRM|nr:peptidoglycan DD-metalloendopeptidase family protein [Pelosinus propionicus]SFL45897.1 Murein DD-endopeptidase MepM and murein hydrolase activator NlpD, contain LysM domain [Pelosinus propionicus DSM 13327]